MGKTYKTHEKIKKRMVIKVNPWDVPMGHQERTGHHVHDNRPRRQRTRRAALHAALSE